MGGKGGGKSEGERREYSSIQMYYSLVLLLCPNNRQPSKVVYVRLKRRFRSIPHPCQETTSYIQLTISYHADTTSFSSLSHAKRSCEYSRWRTKQELGLSHRLLNMSISRGAAIQDQLPLVSRLSSLSPSSDSSTSESEEKELHGRTATFTSLEFLGTHLKTVFSSSRLALSKPLNDLLGFVEVLLVFLNLCLLQFHSFLQGGQLAL